METDKNYFLVGLFVIIMIATGISFSMWLSSAGKGGFDHYRIRFAESVSGLNKESTVKFRGVDIGNVDDISIDPDNMKLIRVDIRVRKDTPIKTDTTATLKLQGVSGDLYVELSGGSENAPTLAAKNSKELPEIKAQPDSLDVVMNRLPAITERTDRLLEKANHIADQISKAFSDENVRALNSVMQALAEHYGVKEDKQ